MRTPIQLISAGLLATLLLTACGGGGGNDAPAAEPDVPDAAMASPEGYTAWAKGLPASDSGEPLNLERLAMVPTSETAEPAALN